MLCSPSAFCAGSQLTFTLFQSNISQGEQAVAVPDDVKVMARWKSSYYPWNRKAGDTRCLGSRRQGLHCIVVTVLLEIRENISKVR